MNPLAAMGSLGVMLLATDYYDRKSKKKSKKKSKEKAREKAKELYMKKTRKNRGR